MSNAARQYDEAGDLPPVGRVRFRNDRQAGPVGDGMNATTRAAFLRLERDKPTPPPGTEDASRIDPYLRDAPGVQMFACPACGGRALEEAGHPIDSNPRATCPRSRIGL